MGSVPLTVSELLSLDPEGSVADATLAASEGIRSLLEDIGGLIPPAARQALAAAVERALPAAMKLPLEPVLAGGWNKLRVVFKYRDTQKYPSHEVYLVSLGAPAITSTHHPYIEVLLNGQPLPIPKFELDLVLSLTFETAVLRIQDAKIKAVQAGKCRGKGTLKYKGAILLDRATKEFALPGAISLGEGLAIG
jgi:hypothetical protein